VAVLVLTLTCTDRRGIIHAVADTLLHQADANIIEQAQFSDPTTGLFCMRTRFETADDPAVAPAIMDELLGRLGDLAPQLRVRDEAQRYRVAVLTSKQDHCLLDLLYRWDRNELPVEIPLIVSNHRDAATLAGRFGVPFIELPVTADTKAAQEAEILALLEQHQVDYIVLARYMQILSNDLCAALAGRVINIHHSFLPGFKGARPYHQAYDRGVKLIGATAHFVTADLDEGPIIEQDVVRVSHAEGPADLTRLGQDIERVVLARAVRDVAEDRVFLLGRRTVVFR
jgi:formyltetrahydrofolate deformylase